VAKVLYRALTQEGKEISGFVEAMSNKEALAQLKESGLEQINLLSDAALGFERDDLNGIGEDELAHIARFETKLQKGIGFFSYFAETMRNSSIPMVIGGAIVFYGDFAGSALWMAFGVIVALALPFFSFWNYGVMQGYNRLLKNLAFGEWEDVKKSSEDLKKQSKNPDVIVEADMRLASYYAHKGDMDKAITIISASKEYLDAKSAGAYENKLGELYWYAGMYEKSIYEMKRAYEISKENIFLVDWALAEARFGDNEIAKECIDRVDTETLPIFGLPFIAFIKGLVSYREDRLVEAKEMLIQAVEGFSNFDKNPVVWIPLSIVSSYLALVLSKLGDQERAKSLLSDGVVAILKEHAESSLLEQLRDEFPDYFFEGSIGQKGANNPF